MKQALKRVMGKETRISLRRLYYSGSRYSCNVCGNRVRTMFTSGHGLPVLAELDVIGGETVPLDVCPICFANGRTRLLFNYLKTDLGIEAVDRKIRLLHIAPEYGIVSWLSLNSQIEHVLADINPAEFSDLGGVKYCDVTAIDEADNSFDLVICSHVLEHVPDDRQAMREFCRVLRPGGMAILQVPISGCLPRTVEDPTLEDPRERERRFGQHDHVRVYGSDYPARLEESGFSVEVFDPSHAWGRNVVAALRLNPREQIFVAKK